MRVIDSYQPKKPHEPESMIVHYGVDNHGKPHMRNYEVSLCSTCRPGDKRCYSFRILKSEWDSTYDRLVTQHLPESETLAQFE
jgi:hypothetical protein